MYVTGKRKNHINKMFSRLLLILFATSSTAFGDIIVELPDGTIRGREAQTTTGNTFYAFEKIPYASPPVGDLRFKAPIPPKKWDGILNTTENNVICYQMSGSSSDQTENCLYLNVFTPELNNEASTYPVMFYIYGGGFISGNCYFTSCGPEYLIDHGVIVVTINYRVGPFGFLSTQDSVIPGNNGLKDQHLAIKWTKDNIHLFGGDPDKITIFGQSAGSASVTYQMLYKKNEGLFRGAIGESGSFLCPWSFQRNARKLAFKTAGFINETFNDSDDAEALRDFLMNVSAEEIHAASSQIEKLETLQYRQMIQGFFYAPVVEPEHEEAFITENMYVSLKAGNFVKVPTLLGINNEESVSDAGDLNWFKNYMENLDNNLDWLVPLDMRIEGKDKLIEMGRSIRDIYTGGKLLSETLSGGVRYSSDTSFSRGVIKHAELQSQFTSVYFYQFSYDGIIGNYTATVLNGSGTVTHGEEARYIWRSRWSGYDNSDLSVFPESDQITQHRIQQIWTDFAKTLNPTPQNTDLMQNITWPAVSLGDKDDFLYVDINENLEVKSNPKNEAYEGWNELYTSLGYDDFDTY